RRPPQSGATAVRPRRLRARPGSGVLALLPDAGLLAGEVAQVVQLRAADVAAGDDLDLVDGRGVHGAHALDADAEENLADAEGLAHAVALATDDVALEDLDARAVALDDLHVHLDVVAGAECGDVLAQGRLVELVELLHVLSPALRLRSDGVVLGAPRPGRPCGTVDPARSGSPYRCAGPLAATPIATDLPDRVLRPPLRQRDARCARGVILPAQHRPGKPGRRGSCRSSPQHGVGCVTAGSAGRGQEPATSPSAGGSRSGRRSRVRARDCSLRQAAIRPWSPDSRIGGASRTTPAGSVQLAGRV